MVPSGSHGTGRRISGMISSSKGCTLLPWRKKWRFSTIDVSVASQRRSLHEVEATASPAGAPYAHDVAHYNRRLTCVRNVMRVVGHGTCAVLTATQKQYLPGTGVHAERATGPCAGDVGRTAGSAGKQTPRKLGVCCSLQNHSPPCPLAHRPVLRLTTGPSVKTALLWPLPRAGTAGDPCVIDVSQRAPTAD